MAESVDREQVQKVVRMLKASEASELSISDGESTITVSRAYAPPPVEAPAFVSPVSGGENDLPEDTGDLIEVTARLVGLFHAGTGPGEGPFVREGDRVEEGQTIGTIEALRNFTEVISPTDGTIEKILAEDGAAVQFGDVLFFIRPG